MFGVAFLGSRKHRRIDRSRRRSDCHRISTGSTIIEQTKRVTDLRIEEFGATRVGLEESGGRDAEACAA